MESLLAARQRALDKALEYLKDTPCMDCTFLSSCAEKGIVNIMERMQIRDCLVGLEHAGDISKSLQYDLGDIARM